MSDLLRCQCPCGCTNTERDCGFFTNETAATLAAMAGEIDHPEDWEGNRDAACEECFCGDWPERCGKGWPYDVLAEKRIDPNLS